MRRNMKITIAAMSVLLLMAIAATIISFSFANNGDEGLVTEEDLMASAAGESETLTNIDYIIRNSNDTKVKDPKYHIVEIGSSASPSTLKDFVESNAFEEYVLNAHGTQGEMMAADKITYQYIQASTVTNTDSRLADVAKADLIYVSNAGGSAGYKVGNDICEELYNLLHTYAVGDYKPLIIDSPTKSGSTDPIDVSKSFTDLVKDYFAKSGAQYYTYGWDASLDAEAFFKGGVGSGSMYIGISGRDARTGWEDLQSADDDMTSKKMAHFLVVSNDGKIGTRAKAVLTGAKKVEESGVDYVYAGVATDSDATIDLTDVYDITGTPVYKYGYNQRYSYRPDFVQITNVSLNDLDSASNTISLDGYDMIIIEDNCGGKQISAALYKKFIAAMYGNNHIVYSASLGTASEDDTLGGNLDDFNETNYSELFYMVATDKEVARYQNIMVTNKTEFDIITSSNSESTCKVIADLINASSWRGIGGPGSSANVFTVLEIQPCYPINTALAQKKKTYYSSPSEIINGQTAEQLGIDESNLTGNEMEFYDWDLSEAIVASALNMNASQIKVVHMSTEELECNKQDILGNYDMVYIGGNTSALRDVTERRGISILNWGYLNKLSDTKGMPTYAMYAHNGDVIRLSFDILGSAGNKTEQGNSPIGKAEYDKTGSNTFTTMSGNDLSYNNYEALVEYVDAGMPVVFSDVVSAAHSITKSEGYYQNAIDPDSNMYNFMNYCKAKSEESDAIQWNLNINDVEMVDNDAGRLGSTQTGYVSVLTEEGASKFNTAYVYGTKKPKLAVTSKPAQYNLYDESTKLTSRTLSYKYDVTGVDDYTATLYIDDDGNSLFADNEAFAVSKTGELSCDLGSFKGGPVYWKLEISSGSGNAKQVVSTTGTAYIKPEEGMDKTPVNILQLIPSGSGVEGAQGVMSLYFCPECQRTYAQIDYNPLSVGVRTSDGALYASADNSTSYGDQYTDDYGFETVSGLKIYMGKHEHSFGVVKYDSNMANTTGAPGRDDWDWNLADELSDLYDFNLDIMDSRQFDKLASDIEAYYSNMGFSSMTAEEKAEVIDQEKANAATALLNLNTFVKTDLKQAQDDLNACIKDKIANCTSASDKAELQRLIDEECYYDYFNIEGINTYSGSTRGRLAGYSSAAYQVEKEIPNTYNNTVYEAHRSASKYAGFEYYYQVYALAVDEKIRLEDVYKQAKYRATYMDNWLLGSYDTIIIGPAENFNNDDLMNPYGVATLKQYVEEDGSILLFHETLGRFSDVGPANLTAALLADFGNDPSHMELDNSLIGDDSKTVESKKMFDKNQEQINPAVITLNTESGKKYTNSYYNILSTDAKCEASVVINSNNVSWGQLQKSGKLAKPGQIDFELAVTTDDPIESATLTFSLRSQTFSFDATIEDGMVKFAVDNYSIVETEYSASDVHYLPYKTQSGYSSSKYFLTNLSNRDDSSRYYSWVDDMKAYDSNFSAEGRYFAPNLYSSSQFIASPGQNADVSPYKYGDLDWSLATKWANSAGSGDSSKAGTNKASQNNSGIITTYPFTLSAQLNITGTHPSAYALDVESDKMTVWYSLAGGTYERANSALYAATPNDGVDNYFIYSYGNVYYCGAGHTKVTGQYKDNNDERRLYINIICNSVRASVRQPSIEVYDYGTEVNKKIVKGSAGYLYEIEEDVEYPIFTFRAIVDEEAKITNVNIYYKLDTGSSNKFVEDVDKYIVKWTGSDVKSGDFVDVGNTIENLKLNDSYFEPYGGNFTYIVIEVIDDQGNVSYQKIKIVRKAHLFDLT